MSNYWKRFTLWWKRYRCKHAHYIEDIERVSSMQVRCPCHKCGEVHHVAYGVLLQGLTRRKQT